MNPDDIVCSIPEYDPLKRLTIPWGDLIAARNAVAQLVLALKERFPPLSVPRQTTVRLHVRGGVVANGSSEFGTVQEALEWLIELRTRLNQLLPSLPIGTVSPGSSSVSYHPDEPMIIPWGDLIGSRNSVAQLVAVLTDPVDPPSESCQLNVKLTVRAGVLRRGPDEFPTLEDAVDWLIELRGRLNGLLPDAPLAN